MFLFKDQDKVTLLLVHSATSKQVFLGVIRKKVVDRVDTKPVICIIPWTLIEFLHPCSCLGFIQLNVTKEHREITLFSYITFDHGVLLQQQKLRHQQIGKLPQMRFGMSQITDAIKGIDLKRETRLNHSRVWITVTALNILDGYPRALTYWNGFIMYYEDVQNIQ